MNPLLLSLLSMFLRQGIFLLAGALGIGPIVHEFVDAHLSEFNQMLLGLAAALATAAYAAYKQFTKRQVLVTALASPVPMSEAEAKSLVKDNRVITPSVTTPKDEIPR